MLKIIYFNNETKKESNTDYTCKWSIFAIQLKYLFSILSISNNNVLLKWSDVNFGLATQILQP